MFLRNCGLLVNNWYISWYSSYLHLLTLLNMTVIYFIACSNVLNLFPFEQKAWEVAQAPFKNLLMMGFMMWMAGSTVHLFSIGITFSALWQPISALQGVGKGKITVNFCISNCCFILTSPCCANHCSIWSESMEKEE
jgi:NADH:ubiquinone oxidoreductase subunit H